MQLKENCKSGFIYMPTGTRFNIQYRVKEIGGWVELAGPEIGKLLSDIGEYHQLGFVRSGFTARGFGTLEVTLTKEGS